MPKIKPKKKVLPKKKAPKAKKKDTALVGATEEISESTQKDIEASSNLPSKPEPPKKLKKVDVSKFLPKKHEEAAQTSSVKLKKKQEDIDAAEETPEPPKPKK